MELRANLGLSPWLSGVWTNGDLCIVDVKHAQHFLVAGTVGYFMSELAKDRRAEEILADLRRDGFPQITDLHIQELINAGLLLSRAAKVRHVAKPEIESPVLAAISRRDFTEAILSSGQIQMRLVATGMSHVTTTELGP